MQINIQPYHRGQKGVLTMPLFKNIPNPQANDWKTVRCPICGELCWESDKHRQLLKEEPGLTATCTMCALKAGACGGSHE